MFEAQTLITANPNSKVVPIFLLPGDEWAFETELCALAARYPSKTFLICCFEIDGPTFRTSKAPLGYPNLRVRYGKPAANIHLVYANAEFGTSNKVLARYFSHLPELLIQAEQCPRFVWADFCCWPSYEAISTLTNDLRKGDRIFSTFSLNWDRNKLGQGVSPCLWTQAQQDKSRSYGWHTARFIASRAGPLARRNASGLRQITSVEYTGDSGNKVPMLISGFEVC